jgi:GNAT superfamily N-acetyltransferase
VDARAALALQRPGHRAFYRLFDGASPGARVVERDDGLLVCTCPARPERSLVNAVVYADGAQEALIAALDDLDVEFRAAGAQAWTVWVAPGDDAVARACAARGHIADATPQLMWAPLDKVLGGAPGGADAALELELAPSWKVLGDVNDAADGLPADHLAITLAGADPDPVAVPRAVARDDQGRPVACAAAVLAGDVAEVVLVATLPEARGRGLAAACMRSCLARARDEHRARWTTLEATKAGEPLYAHMGYRRAGAYGMWARRTVMSEIVG